jgi:hypothetical protein
MRSPSLFGMCPPCSGRSAPPALQAIESTFRPPEGDGVAKAVNRRNAMLPLVARGSTHQIERARARLLFVLAAVKPRYFSRSSCSTSGPSVPACQSSRVWADIVRTSRGGGK